MILTIHIFLSIFLIFSTLTVHAEDCQKAIELYNKGTLSNDPTEKEAFFKEAIPLCSNPEALSRIYNNLADLYENKKEFSRALVYYRKAIETKNDLTTAYISVGDIFFKLGDFYSAFIMYSKGLKYRPEDEEALKGRMNSEEGFKKKMIIYFDLDSSKISDLYLYRLQLIGESIKSNPAKLKVEVVGYTCDLGSKAYNMKLSKRRADVVVQYLKDKYLSDEGMIMVIGKGKENPLLPNRDEEGRILNRRVEIKIMELY